MLQHLARTPMQENMRMSEIALAKINSFAPVAQQADVQPSEESIFVLTSSQLQEIISRAIQEATEPLHDRIETLEATVAHQREDLAALETTLDLHAENDLNQLRLINDLRKDKEPQPLQKDRGEILRALIAANGGKMLATDARKKMHLADYALSRLLSTMKDEIEVRPYHLRKNQKVLVLK